MEAEIQRDVGNNDCLLTEIVTPLIQEGIHVMTVAASVVGEEKTENRRQAACHPRQL